MPDQADEIAAGFFDAAGYAKPGARRAIAAALRAAKQEGIPRCRQIVSHMRETLDSPGGENASWQDCLDRLDDLIERHIAMVASGEAE